MQRTFLNRRNILKILILLSFIGITILSFFLSKYFAKNYEREEKIEETTNLEPSNLDNIEEDDNLINVNMQLIDKFGNVIFDEVREAEDNSVLYDVLIKYHEVRAEKSTYGMVIFDIDSVKTKFYSDNYISILVNGKYSSFGVSSIYVYDGISVTFKEVALWQ